MTTRDTIIQRHSVRAFLDRPVEREKICAIVDTARHAPSGANTQPWQVAVLSGTSKRQLCSLLVEAFERGEVARPDYDYYPENWASPYLERRRACGLQLYTSLAIPRHDKAAQRAQWAANYRAFDAPVMLLFFMDGCMRQGSLLDYGMFLQSLMLAAQEQGLATCPQAALAEYPDIAKQMLGYADDSLLLCGMALGYEDREAAVNSYRTERAQMDTFTRFFD